MSCSNWTKIKSSCERHGAKRLRFHARAVTAVTHAPGFVTVFLEDFEKDLKSWRIRGGSVISTAQHVSGRHSLCFATPGQAEYTLTVPLAAGRAGINFFDNASATGLAWQMEAELTGFAGWPAVWVRLDPHAGSYVAGVSGNAAIGRLPLRQSWLATSGS